MLNIRVVFSTIVWFLTWQVARWLLTFSRDMTPSLRGESWWGQPKFSKQFIRNLNQFEGSSVWQTQGIPHTVQIHRSRRRKRSNSFFPASTLRTGLKHTRKYFVKGKWHSMKKSVSTCLNSRTNSVKFRTTRSLQLFDMKFIETKVRKTSNCCFLRLCLHPRHRNPANSHWPHA